MSVSVQLVVLLFGFLLVNHVQAFRKRIIGGDVFAKEGQFPYVVGIQNPEKVFCTGSIIGERFVVTAAHCVFFSNHGIFTSQKLQVVAGVHDLNLKSSEHRVVVDVEEMFIPVEYNKNDNTRSTGDIAVLKLKKDLGIVNNLNLGKIQLPLDTKSYADIKAKVIGFGLNEITTITKYNIFKYKGLEDSESFETFDGRSDGKLRYAQAKVLEHSECVKLYKKDFNPEITWKHICAQVKQRDIKRIEGVCSGDSGGPLVYNGTLIGVVNTSPMVCRENVKPGVYARVSEFVDFIYKILGNEIDETILRSSA